MSESKNRTSLTRELQALDQELVAKTKVIIEKDPLYGCEKDGTEDMCMSCSESNPNWSCNAVKKTSLSPKEIIEIREQLKKELGKLRAEFKKRALEAIITTCPGQHDYKEIKKILDTIKKAKGRFPSLVD